MESRNPEALLTTLKEMDSVSDSTVHSMTCCVPSHLRESESGLSTSRNCVMLITQLHIPLPGIPHTTSCLVLILNCQLISYTWILNVHEDQARNNGEWLTLHQNRLREAHLQAQSKLRAEATFRKKQFDRHRQVKPDEIPIGERVFTRSHPQGRAKIHDRWNSKIFVPNYPFVIAFHDSVSLY